MIKKINILLFIIGGSLWGYFLINHNLFDEYDGVMQYFSGVNFFKTYEYSGWASHFWPPLQPILLGMGDPVIIGKSIAFFSGIIALVCVYNISILLKIKKESSLLLISIILSSAYFINSFSIVENHALETAFYLLTVWCYLLFDKTKSYKYIILAGICCGIAGLSRYTSYSLALSIGLILGFRFNRTDFIAAALFSIFFILISSIWWVPNFIMHGSPLATWQYLNIGSGIISSATDFNWVWKWWWFDQNNYNGVIDIFLKYPYLYVKNFIINLFVSMALIFANMLFNNFYIGTIAGIVFLILIKWKHNNNIKFLLFSSLIYILVASNAFVFKEALLPITIIIEVVIFYYCFYKVDMIKKKIFILVALSNAIFSIKCIYEQPFLRNYDHIFEYEKIGKIMHENTNKESFLVASAPPQYGYYANSPWISLQLWGANNLCDIINYNVSSQKIYDYAPKSKIDLKQKDIHIDFIIFNLETLKNFTFLNENLEIDKSDRCYLKVKSIYKTKYTNVLKVIK